MAKNIKVNQVFWFVHADDCGRGAPYMDVFVQFPNGHEAIIAQITMADGTTAADQDDPKTAELAREVANELGYFEEDEGDGGSAAPYFYRAQQSWDKFRTAHPNILSRDIHLANAVYYSDLGIKWDENPQLFEKVCRLVERLSGQTDKSIDCIVDAMDNLVNEEGLDPNLIVTNFLYFRDKVAQAI